MVLYNFSFESGINGPKPRTVQYQEQHNFQTFRSQDRTGPGSRKISKPETGLDQDREKFPNFGPDQQNSESGSLI